MDVNEPVGKEGTGTSLQIAAELGSLPITRLLDHGADVNAPGDPKRGPTLVRAAVFSRIDVIQMLLNEGAGITGRDRESYRGAVKAAFLKELYVTANLLRAHGKWTSEYRRWMSENLLPKPVTQSHHPENLWKSFEASTENDDTANWENGRESSGKCRRSNGNLGTMTSAAAAGVVPIDPITSGTGAEEHGWQSWVPVWMALTRCRR